MIFSQNFLDGYRCRVIDWGPIGEVTYSVFYSRLKDTGTKEDWVDTVARVCNGVFDIQKWHCQVNDRPFNVDKAIRNAHTMFDLIFNFKFTPPGRGLWAMGTDAMWAHGGGVLNNCGFFSTKEMNPKPFLLLMHFSMLGVGCGMDTLGAGTRVVQRPGTGEIYHKVGDSREGWVDSVEAILGTYFYGQPMPVFDYSGVRGKGAILKTFGGIASGPGPLIKLHEYIRKLCDAHVGRVIGSEFITDLANVIGKCTEAGNIRRSAEIILGEYGDLTFYDLKNDIDKVIAHRSMSNNSIKCIPGCDYSGIAERIVKTGEPGIFWLWNAQRYGRMNGRMDPSDMQALGTNPCIVGSTLIQTTDGEKTIESLVGTNPDVYCKDDDNCLVIRKANRVWKTSDSSKIIKVTTSRGEIELTPNHKVFTENRGWVPSGNLAIGDTVTCLQRVQKSESYLRVKLSSQKKYTPEHRLVAGYYSNIVGKDVHHKDDNPHNNAYLNLEVLEKGQHSVVSNLNHEDWSERDSGTGRFIRKFKKRPKKSKSFKTGLRWKSVVTKLEVVEDQPTFNMSVEQHHNYVANGLLVANCVEQTLWDKELCNLVETYMARHDNLHQYMRTLKMSFMYAKIVTLMKTGFKETDEIIEQNRRIGCSQSGIIRAFNKHGRAHVLDWSDKGYDFLTGLDADYSCWLGVNRSIKRTSIKPSGTVPLLCGETGALNYPISEYYHRTIRIAANHPVIPRLEAANYKMETNVTDSGQMVVYFPVHEKDFVKGEADVSMWEQLENAAAMQEYWCDNQVSVTIKHSKEEGKDIPAALELYENRLKAVSFLQKDSTFYPQAPYQAIDERRYAAEVARLKPLNLEGLTHDAEAASGCDGGKCDV